MTEPEGDDRPIDAMSQEFHGGGVPQDMRGHAFPFERWTSRVRGLCVTSD